MASFYDITIGQQVEFQRVLAKAGFTDADIARIIKDPSVASKMYAAIQPQIVDAGTPLAWWRTPEQQLERAYQLWPDVVLPEPPADFVPQTETEVLLLHVPDTFDALWDKVIPPMGYTKHRSASVRSGRRYLCLAPNKREYAESVWVAFDPQHGKNEPPYSFWGRANTAASEVFSALIQFPDWPLVWKNGGTAPCLTGYQLRQGNSRNWLNVPCLSSWGASHHRLALSGWRVGDESSNYASPTVREC